MTTDAIRRLAETARALAEVSPAQLEFERGLAQAADPTNAAVVLSGDAVTTVRSPWFHRLCPTCRHTFRIGDMVERGPNGAVRHRGSEFACDAGGRPLVDSTKELAEFFQGLDEEWPPPPDLPIRRLDPQHPLVAMPADGCRRPMCVVCAHTLRPNDHVIICPCHPHAPACQAAVHRDPENGLHCFEAWNPGGTREYCPLTGRELHERPV